MLNYEINKLQHQIEIVEIIEDNSDEDASVIKVGFEIRVYIEYSDGDCEEDTFILTGRQGKLKK